MKKKRKNKMLNLRKMLLWSWFFVSLLTAFDIETNLPVDRNGYYHLKMRDSGQTLSRLSVDVGIELAKVRWNTDGVFDVAHMGHSFPTKMINRSSYTNGNGIAYTMFGPMYTMVGDTVTVTAKYGSMVDTIKIILD